MPTGLFLAPVAKAAAARGKLPFGSSSLWFHAQDGGVLYNFQGSTSLPARLHPAAHAQLSPEDVAIWQSEPWRMLSEYHLTFTAANTCGYCAERCLCQEHMYALGQPSTTTVHIIR